MRSWNATEQPYARDKGIHQLFEEQAERTPDAPAIHFANTQLSYREANQQANVLARHLQGLGVGPGMLVGHCMERSAEMLVALLGILKTGAAYVPIDPDYPQERVAYMLEDSQVQVIVSQPWLVDSLPAHQAQVVCLEELDLAMTVGNPELDFYPQQPAYIIYTSGSTGKPKGTILPHQSVVNFFASIAQRPGMSADDRILAVTSLSFDIAVLELLLPLTLGAQVFVVSRAVATNGAELVQQLEQVRPTLMQATPATWRMLLASGWSGDESAELKMLCGGEVLPQEIVQPLLERGASLWNMYGPTETTIWSTLEQIEAGQPILIGQPIANTQTYVLNPQFVPTPVGVVGELYIAGDGLAWGYRHRADLTAERFLPDPFSTVPGARMYRTGDLAHWNSAGKLECLGRTDRQVKLRGHRIELGEIETVLAQHPAVQSCAVIVYQVAAGNQQLVGYVVPEPGTAPALAELRAYLRAALPEYMVPNTCVLLEALPLTPNGKVDRNNLPAPWRLRRPRPALCRPHAIALKRLS
nr:amino acid adenylation domain-containing protein [Dictyobacter vulcani]